jgi:hypothetical protein
MPASPPVPMVDTQTVTSGPPVARATGSHCALPVHACFGSVVLQYATHVPPLVVVWKQNRPAPQDGDPSVSWHALPSVPGPAFMQAKAVVL